MDQQDFDKGLDFTGIVSATAAEHNQLVDQASPYEDSATEGKSINLRSIDSALDTPIVPDPDANVLFNKWKRYIWIRVPHSTATSRNPILYAWNEDASSDAILLKWQTIDTDTSALQAQINTALANASSAVTTAGNANTTANTAATQAAAALSTANDASAAVAVVEVDVNNANVTANGAATTATNAQTQANAALLAATTEKTPETALTPGTAYQVVQTNTAATDAEWVTPAVLQTVAKKITGGASTGVAIPVDVTIPQVTEGAEFISLGITPKRADTTLRITFSAMCDTSGAGEFITVALFKNGAADAIFATFMNCSDLGRSIVMDFVIASGVAGTLQTFSIRFGPEAGTGYLGRNAFGNLYGTAGNSTMTIQEISATIT